MRTQFFKSDDALPDKLPCSVDHPHPLREHSGIAENVQLHKRPFIKHEFPRRRCWGFTDALSRKQSDYSSLLFSSLNINNRMQLSCFQNFHAGILKLQSGNQWQIRFL